MRKFLPKNISKNNPNHSIPLVGLSSFGTLLDSNFNNVVRIKKGKLLSLMSGNKIEIGTTYIITDIIGIEQVIVYGVSTDSISSFGSALMYIPDYTITGVYKGQLLETDTVSIGDRYIWGNQIWENLDGNNPPPLSEIQLDPSSWDLLSKSVSNNYILQKFNISYDPINFVLNFCEQTEQQNSNSSSSFFILLGNPDASKAMQWSNNSLALYQHTGRAFNNKIISNGILFNNKNLTFNFNYVYDEGSISNNSNISSDNSFLIYNIVRGTNSGIDNNTFNNSSYQNNTVESGGKITTNTSNNSTIENNTVSGFGSTIGYGFQHDASEVIGNNINGDHCRLEAFQQNNNSKINSNTINGNSIVISGISQLILDEINDNTINANNINFVGIVQNGYSKITGFNITQDNFEFNGIELTNAQLKNFTYNSGIAKTINNITVYGSILENATNITIDTFKLSGTDINLSGFTKDIINETIENGIGWFTIVHDFSTTPLNNGSSILYNLIPLGARISDIKAIGNISGGGGAVLDLGLEVNDVSLISDTLGNYSLGKSFSGFSGQATANRSLSLSASVNNITSGILTIKVEFIL